MIGKRRVLMTYESLSSQLNSVPESLCRSGFCGVVALGVALSQQEIYYNEKELLKILGTTEELGTSHADLIKGAEHFGLSAQEVVDTGLDALHVLRRDGKSVILNWMAGSCEETDGHYSTLIEVTDQYIVVADSEAGGNIRIMKRTNFEDRWHDIDWEGKRYTRWALILSKK